MRSTIIKRPPDSWLRQHNAAPRNGADLQGGFVMVQDIVWLLASYGDERAQEALEARRLHHEQRVAGDMGKAMFGALAARAALAQAKGEA